MRLYVVLALIVFMAAFRWLPHPWNISPNMALAIVAGFYLKGSARYLVPIAVIVAGDIGLAFTNGYGLSNFTITPLSIATAAFIVGLSARTRVGLVTSTGLSLTGSTVFFILSNLMVWGMSTMYTHDLTGLTTCFAMALPFYKNSLFGDLVFTLVMVAIAELAYRPTRRKVGVTA